ncbi:MAG TPA: actin cross-linking domain-containing toxin [Kofleriaceae bacterium]|nr:actin cross-linking domain-containing toxin [Kofleriaceae bacterium]
MAHQHKTASSEGRAPVQARAAAVPGKSTLVAGLGASLVQRKGTGGPADADVHAAAARGTATPSSPLPFASVIQRAFGRHDVSGVQAHVGAGASESTRAMGAHAYATGSHVVLGDRGQDLHTVAHEAAHVVQQRAGAVQLKGGVGAAGDAYEQHADRVADAVVQGKSAEGLLDEMAGPAHGGGGSGGAVQRVTDYAGNTVGVEQEMMQHKVIIPNRNDRGVLGYVTGGVPPTKLVEYTSDIGGTDARYTIELRTTPCVKSDPQAVQARKDAIAELIRQIEAAGAERRAVAPGTFGAFTITITKPEHRIDPPDFGGGGFANQASMGVPAKQLTATHPDQDTQLIVRNAAWYKADLAGEFDPADTVEPDRARQTFAMVGSVVSFLAGIVRGGGPHALSPDGDIEMNIYDSQVKNRWGTLPRTPPWDWIDTLDNQGDRTKVKQQLRARFTTNPVDKAAFNHIVNKTDLAGHPVPASTVNHDPSAVFEFRSVPFELKPYLHGEEGATEALAQGSQAPRAMDPQMRALLMNAAHMRRRRGSTSSDSSDTDDDGW